jgi:subtilisin family serine protease
MSEPTSRFPHINLRLVREGIAAVVRSPRAKSATTTQNLSDQWGHGTRLKSSTSAVVANWETTIAQRQVEDQPPLPDNAIPLILQIDPDGFDPADLRTYGIEVIAELENGFIIGASADLSLSKLQEKIECCINQQRGGKRIAEVWEILDGTRRPEYILSEQLLAQWDQVEDSLTYTVDIGVACVGEQSQFSDYPKPKADEASENYTKRFNRWLEKRDQTTQQWDDLQFDRLQMLDEFIQGYSGAITSTVDDNLPNSAKLPDSFTCRVQISGKGLKDLVLNFPYVFDVSEPDQFAEMLVQQGQIDAEASAFQLTPPKADAPKVCIIDSGIMERHPLLRAAIDRANSRSWVPGNIDQTADQVTSGGHGTRVAGAVLYPQAIPRTGQQAAICWLQNARILNDQCQLPPELFPPELLQEIIEFYYQRSGTRIFNHSVTGSVPCRVQSMSAWAAQIDQLTWQHDILVIVAAGNLPLTGKVGNLRLSVTDHLAASRVYPVYLLENSARIANPAQSFQALTVGSVAASTYHNPPYRSVADQDYPSAFSCTGLGLWETIKPEVVEYGGDLVSDAGNPPSLTSPTAVCPELVRSTLGGGPAIASDQVGTSFAAPKVAHIAAALAAELPQASCLLYRALIVQSARLPAWTASSQTNLFHAIRQMGYGIPNLDRALGSSPQRITLITQGEQSIRARQAQVYQVKLPQELRSPGESYDILVEVTLSYKAEPRRTRRQRRKYLSTWLDWECSKRGEASYQIL